MPKPPTMVITDQNPPAFNLSVSDDAQITFGAPTPSGGLTFTDTGVMAVTQLTIAGLPQDLHGKSDGLFIQYTGTGVQSFGQYGPTSAVYDTLHYQLVSYKGDATFSHAADGSPVVSGAKNLTVIAEGDLISGQLGFTPTGDIAGQVDATYKVDGSVLGTIDISVHHAAGDIGQLTNGLTLSGGTTTAMFLPT